MASLEALPIDLLPLILSFLQHRRDLYCTSLVCKQWYHISTPLLYRWVRLFGRDLALAPTFFRTISDAPHLCRFIKKLEVRVYPLSLIVKERRTVEAQAVKLLSQCVNVEELIWTRKGALTDAVFEAITSLSSLKRFELNASTDLSPGSWSGTHLLNLPVLQSLSLILPDRIIASLLPDILSRQLRNIDDTEAGLGDLTILCRESPVMNDQVLLACLPHLSNSNLRSLSLAGCTKLTSTPLLTLLPKLPHLQHLALESTGIHPSFYELASPHLTHLRSLKMTHPGPRHSSLSQFYPSLRALLRSIPSLESFTMYYSGSSQNLRGVDGTREWPRIESSFIENLINESIGGSLKKFEVSGVLGDLRGLELVAGGFGRVRDLVWHLGDEFDEDRIGFAIASLRHLKSLHLLSQRGDVQPSSVLKIAQQSSPALKQIGFRNRVWVVKREIIPGSQEVSVDSIKVSLEKWDSPFWPEALLVVRT